MRNKVVAESKLNRIVDASKTKMESQKCNSGSIDFFTSLLSKMYLGDRGLMKFGEHIRKVSEGKVVLIDEIKSDTSTLQAGQENLGKVAVIKLNGGLGTSMGLSKAKSLLPVLESGETYLDIIINQILALRNSTGKETPLVLLDSFSTQDDSLAYLAEKHPNFSNPNMGLDMLQNKHPKVKADNLMPSTHSDEQYNWNPPGHGDVYTVLYSSGMLQKMLDAGMEYAFISNSDNLAATVDPAILGFMIRENVPFVMETARRTEADKKGGHLAEDMIGNLVLREGANCSEEEAKDNFENVELWKDFNTNNIWVNLRALKDVMDANGGMMPLDLIVNPKSNNPTSSATEEDKVKVLQVETAMGSAIRYFPGAKAVRINTNERFLPTKKASDLMLLMSDAIVYDDNGVPYLNGRDTKPVVLLDSSYKTVQDLKRLCPKGIPSLKNCDRLEIKGEVVFGENVVISGNVNIVNLNNFPIIISDNVVIENDVNLAPK